jgi:putative ATP-dependent endonuclease of OLD family
MPEFQSFVEGLQTELTNLVASMTHQLEVDFEAYNPVNFFHALDLHASESGEPRTLDEMGTGEQQVLGMAFAHAYARAFHTGVLLVIEEPESHLHPLAQEWLSARLSDMCADGLQIVITTHSPAFVNILNLDGLVLVRKDAGGTSVVQIDRQMLVEHCIAAGAPADKTTPENILSFYAANVTRDILEGFFAKTVVLVEGPTESLSLPVYLQKAGLITAKEGIAVIGVQGKGNLGKWHRLFSAFEIPCFVVFDNDASGEDKTGIRRKDALSALGIVAIDKQKRFLAETDLVVGDQFAIFGSNFEQVLRAYFPKYAALELRGRQRGVESKPFLARYVADNLTVDDAPGWIQMQLLAKAIQTLAKA